METHNYSTGGSATDEHMEAMCDEFGKLAENARALIAATADVAGDKVAEARRHLSTALESGKQLYGQVRTKALEGAKIADAAIVENPYKAMAIGVGVGALLGFLLTRRCCNGRE